MEKVEFPNLLCHSSYKQQILRQSDEDALISFRIESHLKEKNPKSWREFLTSCELEEKETLNQIAKAGACQFSSLADQLFDSTISKDFRPDVLLRQLALYILASNAESYKDFMLHADPRTRRQRSRGGENISVDEYIRRMSNEDCDGDHITLQAICDALKVRINVVKWVHYEDGEIADAGSSDSGRSSPQNWNIFVADTITPRSLRDIDRRLKSIQLPHRTLWISLHGEAHYKSLRCLNVNSPEISRAKVHTPQANANPTKYAPGITQGKGNVRTILSPCVKAQNLVTCGICLEDIEDEITKASLENCKHEFHIPCITQWSSVTNMCPLCKERFNFIVGKGRKIPIQHKDAKFEMDDELVDESLDDIVCFVCADAEDEANLLICDGDCGRGAHTYCIGLELIPEGCWFCQSCQRAANNEIDESANIQWQCDPDSDYEEEDKKMHASSMNTPEAGQRQARGIHLSQSQPVSRRNLLTRNERQNHSRSAQVQPRNTTRAHPARYESRAQANRRTAAQREARHRMAAIAASPWIRTISSPQTSSSAQPLHNQFGQEVKVKAKEKNALDSSSDEDDSVQTKAWADLVIAKQGLASSKKRAVETLNSSSRKRARLVATNRRVNGAHQVASPADRRLSPPSHNLNLSNTPSMTKLPAPPKNGPSVLKLLGSISSANGSHSQRRNVSRPSISPSSHCRKVAESLVGRLIETLTTEREQYKKGWSMLRMQGMLRELQNHVHSASSEQSEAFLNAGILSALKEWLEPLPDGNLPPLRVRTGVIRILLVLPARKEHVRNSGGLSLHLIKLAQHEEETEENKMLISTLVVKNWSKLAENDHCQPVWKPFYTKQQCTAPTSSVHTRRKVRPSYSGGKVKPSVPTYDVNGASSHLNSLLGNKSFPLDSLQSIQYVPRSARNDKAYPLRHKR